MKLCMLVNKTYLKNNIQDKINIILLKHLKYVYASKVNE